MIPVNIIFKVTKHNPDDKSIEIKSCCQNSSKPIDEYPTVRVEYRQLDFSSTYNLQESIRSVATDQAIKQFRDEKILDENQTDEIVDGLDIDGLVGKIVKISHNDMGLMREIIL